MIAPRLAHLAESIELQLTEAFWAVRPDSIDGKNAQQLFRLGGALLTVAPGSVSLQRNRVLGLGVEEPAAAQAIDQVLDIFRAFRVKRLSFHRSPCRQYDEIGGWLSARGFRPHHAYSKLVRRTEDAPELNSELRVRRIGVADAAAFARVFGAVFAAPAARHNWIAASIGASGFSHYMAFADDRPVAVGAVYVRGDAAWMGWAGTVTRYRRKGAHAALVAARVRRAAELGAKWIVCETLEPRPGRPSGSYRNLLKSGFEQAYLRPIWAWES